jgi:hypothetical protein
MEYPVMNLYNRPTILMCKQCGLTRVADNYDEAKAKAEIHGTESKHYDFELLTLDDCPRASSSIAALRRSTGHRKGMNLEDGVDCK